MVAMTSGRKRMHGFGSLNTGLVISNQACGTQLHGQYLWKPNIELVHCQIKLKKAHRNGHIPRYSGSISLDKTHNAQRNMGETAGRTAIWIFPGLDGAGQIHNLSQWPRLALFDK